MSENLKQGLYSALVASHSDYPTAFK
jgi:hypothetical protein